MKEIRAENKKKNALKIKRVQEVVENCVILGLPLFPSPSPPPPPKKKRGGERKQING